MNMTDAQRQEASRRTGIVANIVHFFDGADLAAIFYMMGSEALKLIFEQSMRFLLLPVAAAANIIMAGLAIRQAALNKGDGHLAARAAVEVIGALAITTAVAGAIATAIIGSTLFAVVGPAIFAATFAFKSLFNIGSAIYFGIKAAKTDEPEKKFEYRKKAIESAVGAVVGMAMAAVVTAVAIFAKPAIAVLGVIGGAMIATIALFKGIDLVSKKPVTPPPSSAESDDEYDELTNNAAIQKLLSKHGKRPPPPASKPQQPASQQPGKQPNEGSTHEAAALLTEEEQQFAAPSPNNNPF